MTRGRKSTGKRNTFRFRLTDDLRKKLEAERVRAAKPVSEIIEARLEQSFLHEDLIAAVREEIRQASLNTQQARELPWWTKKFKVKLRELESRLVDGEVDLEQKVTERLATYENVLAELEFRFQVLERRIESKPPELAASDGKRCKA